MASTFVSVPRATLETHLAGLGFVPAPQSGQELVYEFTHKRKTDLVIRCFTSINVADTKARSCGADAIRVCTVWRRANKTLGVYRGKPVHRCGSIPAVLERITERLRDAYAHANHLAKCAKCGGHAFNDSGRCFDPECRAK